MKFSFRVVGEEIQKYTFNMYILRQWLFVRHLYADVLLLFLRESEIPFNFILVLNFDKPYIFIYVNLGLRSAFGERHRFG